MYFLVRAKYSMENSKPYSVLIEEVPLGNYLIFFAPAYFRGTLASHKTRERRRRFETARLPADAPLHACVVCGATERTHPDFEFRVASDGNEYCTGHLPVRRE